MKIKIWSDIRCPFCYIGKHKFEKALEKFAHKDDVIVSWHSFELDPTVKTDPEMSSTEYFAKTKGMGQEQVNQMMEGASNMGKEMGLTLDFENTKVANSFNAHRLIQLAKTQDLDNEIEEVLFKAYFEEGKNIDDKSVLREIGKEVGLKEVIVDRMLFTDEFKNEVEKDKQEAASIGVKGVPFFVFNNKYAVSGAQPEEAFLEVLEKSWEEYKSEHNPTLIVEEGQSCDADGNCD